MTDDKLFYVHMNYRCSSCEELILFKQFGIVHGDWETQKYLCNNCWEKIEEKKESKTMTPQEIFYDKMLELFAESKKDTEKAHSDADDLMCEELRKLGYEKSIDLFEHYDWVKWYS